MTPIVHDPRSTHHLDRCDLYKHSLGEGHIRWFGHVDTLPGQCLDDVPVAQVVEVGVPVDVGQRRAVQVSVRQSVDDARLEVFHALGRQQRIISRPEMLGVQYSIETAN